MQSTVDFEPVLQIPQAIAAIGDANREVDLGKSFQKKNGGIRSSGGFSPFSYH